MKRRFLALLAAAVCFSQARAAAPLETKQVCDAIAQRRATVTEPVQLRTKNFFLFDAAARGCDGLAAAFLAEGASVEARDRFGNTALSIAARSGQVSTVKLLLAKRSDAAHVNLAGSSVLLRAVTANRRRVAKLLLQEGADPNLANKRGITPLAAAAFNGNDRLLAMLLKAGADPTAIDATGKGPMIYAAARGYTEMVGALLDAGVDPNAVYGHGLTALMWAAGHTNDTPASDGLATVTLLLERGARIEPADDRGRDALMIAAERGHAEIVALLLERGADPTRRDGEGKTAATLAASDAVRTALTRRY